MNVGDKQQEYVSVYTPQNITAKNVYTPQNIIMICEKMQSTSHFSTNFKSFFFRLVPLALKKTLDEVQLVKAISLQSLGA